jgi:hypothetical protein
MSAPESANQAVRRNWSGWAMLALERIPIPYPLLMALVGVMAAAEQMLEYSVAVQMGALMPNPLGQATVFVTLFVYILVVLRMLKRAALGALMELRTSVFISDEAYDRHAHQMVSARWGIEVALLVSSIVIVALLFGVAGSDLMILGGGFPASLPLKAFMAFTYVFLGWLLLSLIYATIRQARALGALARCPLEVNVYHPANLFPFGRLSVWHGVAIVGLVMIPLLILGMPSRAGFLVIGFSVIGLAAVFIPLWGVHDQISHAKAKALNTMSQQLLEVQTQWLDALNHNADESKRLSDRINMLLTLRKVIDDSPSWPFRSEAALVRAVIAAASPLVYFVLNQLLLRFVLSGGVR